jgi:mono/diheme cytochrome c family protein
MSLARRNAVPFAAGVAAAVAAFAVVALTTGDGDDGQAARSGQAATAPSPLTPPRGEEAGAAVFMRMGCGGCHTLAAAGSTGPIGPNLDTHLPNHDRESLTRAILTPPPDAAMPGDFGERMSDRELDALVRFLLAVREPR